MGQVVDSDSENQKPYEDKKSRKFKELLQKHLLTITTLTGVILGTILGLYQVFIQIKFIFNPFDISGKKWFYNVSSFFFEFWFSLKETLNLLNKLPSLFGCHNYFQFTIHINYTEN